MMPLRSEILQAQQTRSDLLKWKLGLVGVIGSIGLGLAGARPSTHADLVLCAVPLVCAYVDLLCRHLSLRMLVIGAYFQRTPSDEEAAKFTKYETFVDETRDSSKDPFALENAALTWSTVVLSCAVVVYGAAIMIQAAQDSVPAGLAFIFSGAIGLVATLMADEEYDDRSRALKGPAEKQEPA